MENMAQACLSFIAEILSSQEILMAFKTICFLSLVALGGYMLVYFHRRNWFMKGELSLSQKGSKERIEIIDRKWLGGRQYLSLIRCGKHKVLVGITRDRMIRLMEIREPSGK
ncbi:MAG: flagellar biosynthetic protein FliO [Puniceicoccales bacterium]|jgi:flagellar biogenesis protein FliO|nr:flagellar biosynthetic protein FliO [Puniceicoccales bacterium]